MRPVPCALCCGPWPDWTGTAFLCRHQDIGVGLAEGLEWCRESEWSNCLAILLLLPLPISLYLFEVAQPEDSVQLDSCQDHQGHKSLGQMSGMTQLLEFTISFPDPGASIIGYQLNALRTFFLYDISNQGLIQCQALYRMICFHYLIIKILCVRS